MFRLTDKNITIVIITIFHIFKNLIERENMKKTQIKLLEMKIIMFERKNILEGTNGRLDIVENIIKLKTY